MPGLRESRRRDTGRRIVRAAVQLTAERGYDGFTVEELVEIVGVSRRTFFNCFPSKDDALLGNPHDGFSPEARETFLAGTVTTSKADSGTCLTITPRLLRPPRSIGTSGALLVR